jgi:hypothetical protein
MIVESLRVLIVAVLALALGEGSRHYKSLVSEHWPKLAHEAQLEQGMTQVFVAQEKTVPVPLRYDLRGHR